MPLALLETTIAFDNYMKSYVGKLNDTTQFYSNLNWTYIKQVTEADNIDLIKLKVDEFYDEWLQTQFDHLLVGNPSTKNFGSTIDDQVQTLMLKMNLKPFEQSYTTATGIAPDSYENREDGNIKKNATNESVIIDIDGDTNGGVNGGVNGDINCKESNIKHGQKYFRVPDLTKKQRRLSLDLIQQQRPFSKGDKLSASAAPKTSTVNVLATTSASQDSKLKQKAKVKSKFDFPFHHNPAKLSSRQNGPGKRRTSMVSEKLPKYIQCQLRAQRPLQKITPKPSMQPLGTTVKRKQSQLNPLKTLGFQPKSNMKLPSNHPNLQSTNTPADTSAQNSADTSYLDRGVHYSTIEDDYYWGAEDEEEYILPNLLARLYGLQFEEREEYKNGVTDTEGEDQEEEEAEEEEDEYEEGTASYLNVSAVLTTKEIGEENNKEDGDYLFKI